ncbi:protein-tyrosine kinase [Serratia proteamaculans]|uniref:tyrosine-protein kinase Wzc n=1 Tax=Serratia proteamaculans TaxID=28151 RepID=UPI0009F7DA2A|nr:tyrosine-protein kinase Wzc [Serratia proteamaculans]SMB29421.1 protein-tyrosine kinase [Serratia proteamaculans]
MADKERVYKPSSEEKGEIDIARLTGLVIDSKWLILAITSFFALISVLYLLFATPIYRSDALVQVEQKVGNSILSNISEMLPTGAQPESAAEIELIRSRMVLGKTIEDLGLNTVIKEKYFPIFGQGWERLFNKENHEIAISRFNVNPELLNIPLELVILENDKYTLSSKNGELLSGAVGHFISKNGVSILVSGVDASEGTIFNIIQKPLLETYNELYSDLNIADKGKDTGVLGLSLTGEDPTKLKKILNSIINNYLQQNVDRKSEEAGKSLEFVKKQLPSVRGILDAAEDKLNLYRRQNDSVDLSLEAKSVLDSSVAIETQLNELTFREAEISKLFTKEHPSYKTLLENRKTLEEEKGKIDKRISSMPKTQQEILRLTRDVEASQIVYMQLLNKQQELSISKASTVGNVRIVDPAETQIQPVAPKKTIILAASIILGILLSLCIVFLRSVLRKGIDSAEQLEEVGVNVYASIPLSDWQQKTDKVTTLRQHKTKRNIDSILAVGNPADLAMEAIRSLRTSLYFGMLDAANNILMVSGASPGIGKTFVSVNLAAVIAQAGQKVLIVDCDLRKGYLHDLFNQDGSSGLSAVLSGQAHIQDVLRSTTVPNLDFISRGKVPPNPSELLMHRNFVGLLDWAKSNYDLVLVDTPPILAVTDAAIIGRHAGTSMMVARFEINTLKEMEASIRRFEQNGIDIKGVILNAVEKRAASYYGYYNYDYRTDEK